MYLMLTPAKANPNNLIVEDVDKTVLSRQPYQIEVCYEEQVPGDKSGDMIKGALLGGLLGNNIKGEVNGGAAEQSWVACWVTHRAMLLVAPNVAVS